MATSKDETPWHVAYPAPRTQSPATITQQQVLQLFKDGQKPGKDFALIDLRRTDYEGGTILGSINLPAQSLYPTLATVYTLLDTAGIQRVIWYCGSSGGRGTRAACWFTDLLEDEGNKSMKSLVLTGGIKGWVKAGEEYLEKMTEYDPRVWKT